MLVFFIILIINLLSLIVYLSGIKIQIEELEIEKRNKIHIDNLQINIYFMLFNKIKLLKGSIGKEKIEKIDFHKIKDKMMIERIIPDNRKILKIDLDKLDTKIDALNIKAKLGVNNAFVIVYLITLINIVLSIFFVKISKDNKIENYSYCIKPLQTDRFYLKLSINCIINLKIANIINMIIKNRSEDKNERTSNRRLDGNYHEQYTRYGRCKHYNRSTN